MKMSSVPAAAAVMVVVVLLSAAAATVTGQALVPGVMIFGDSVVDAGNNNRLATLVRADFPPYGRDFPATHAPTGRFCNGKLATDYTGRRRSRMVYFSRRVWVVLFIVRVWMGACVGVMMHYIDACSGEPGAELVPAGVPERGGAEQQQEPPPRRQLRVRRRRLPRRHRRPLRT
jgi:hypothetical protein